MLLFWPCIWGLTLVYDFNSSLNNYFFFSLLFLAGSILMRSAGCIINDVVDKNFDQVFRTGRYTQDDFQISGGDANKTYLFSYSRLNQDGIIRNSYYDRDNVRLNTKFRLSPNVSMSSKVGYTYSSSNRLQRGSNVSGVMLGFLRTPADYDNEYYKGSYWSGGTEYTGRHRAYRRYLGGSSTNPIYNNPANPVTRINERGIHECPS